jgi:lysophospholipase L1-like esterase
MTVSSSRRIRQVAVAAGCVGLALTFTGFSSAAAGSAAHGKAPKQLPVAAGSRYLALGDSITFGYREPTSVPTPNFNKPRSFVGYPEDIANNLGLRVTNAACPGETTDSFIKTSGQSNGCENNYSATAPHTVPGGYRGLYPLHVKYKSQTQSQLAFAEAFLKQHPATRLVSLMIGANDGLLCIDRTSDGCVSEFSDLQKHVTKNVSTILKGIRSTGYNGQIALLTYYSLDYSNSLDNFEETGLNQALAKGAKPYHVRLANGFREFRKASRQADGNVCTAQVVTSTPSGSSPCGIHPSYSGQALLAQAVEMAVKK